MRASGKHVITASLLALPIALISAQEGAPKRDVPPAMRSVLGVALNRDSALSIVAKLGLAQAWSSGEGHDRFVNWCFRSGDGTIGATLHLMSDDSDMGTESHQVNVIRIFNGSSRAIDGHKCATLRTGAAISGVGPLSLAATRDEVRRLLGQPTRSTADSLVYDLNGEEALDPNSPFFAHWNTPEKRQACFQGRSPFVSVGGMIATVFASDRVREIRIERYNNAIC